MSDRTVYTVRQGAVHQLTLASPLSSSFTATCTADIRALPGGRTSYNPSETVADSYTVTTFAGDSDYGPGWYLTLDDTETAALTPGLYVGQARISYTAPSTTVQLTQQWLLQVEEAVTDAP